MCFGGEVPGEVLYAERFVARVVKGDSENPLDQRVAVWRSTLQVSQARLDSKSALLHRRCEVFQKHPAFPHLRLRLSVLPFLSRVFVSSQQHDPSPHHIPSLSLQLPVHHPPYPSTPRTHLPSFLPPYHLSSLPAPHHLHHPP